MPFSSNFRQRHGRRGRRLYRPASCRSRRRRRSSSSVTSSRRQGGASG